MHNYRAGNYHIPYMSQDFLPFLKIFQLPSQYFHAFKVGRPVSGATSMEKASR